ncbi:class I SAM-dependent methyltransferase [Candidatus Saccharibacteria bacterium oral taxon 488]|nr:class I SAM-dependent methyltransferase [Candidatus Saccharibacteria bacterium oral taxon 488]
MTIKQRESVTIQPERYGQVELSECGAELEMDRWRIHPVPTCDRYQTQSHEKVVLELEELTDMGFRGETDLTAAIKRQRKTIDYTNQATRELIARVPGVEDWLELIPTASALDLLYDPSIEQLANGKPVSPEVRDWACNILDAHGIRSRGKIVQDILAGHVIDQASLDATEQQWISLACGAAQPVCHALRHIKENGHAVPRVTLVDLDRSALKAAKTYAQAMKVKQSIDVRCMNILRPQGVVLPAVNVQTNVAARALRRRVGLEGAAYDAVDAVGILEYVPEALSDESPTALQVNAATFLAHAAQLVKPGGLLLVGNMRDTHPQLGFTLNVVQWPHIQPRSIETMQQIVEVAGLGDWRVDVYCPDDGVYALYAMHRPKIGDTLEI